MSNVHTHVKRTLKDFLDNTKEIKLLIPKTTGITSRLYLTIDDETVRVGSNAFLQGGIDVCIYALTEKDSISPDCFEQIFESGKYSESSTMAIIGMRIGRIQDIKVKGCNPSK